MGVGIEEHLGRTVDLDLTFNDEDGKVVKLRDFFNKGRPVLLDLVYYNCPQLCTLILNRQVEIMKEMPWTPGNQYEVVTISIDPRETPEIARQKKASYLASYGRPADGWHFLTDRDDNAKRLAELIGYHYRWDPRIQQYAHLAGIMILTPEGKMARYLYGINYRALTCASDWPRRPRTGARSPSKKFCCSAITTIPSRTSTCCSPRTSWRPAAP